MKLQYDSLDVMLAELRHLDTRAVRLSPITQMETAVPPASVPLVTRRLAVTAVVDDRLWAEWRLWVGCGLAEVNHHGDLGVPESLERRTRRRLDEVRERLDAMGFRCREGVIAPDNAVLDALAL